MNRQEYEERMKDPRYKELEITDCKSGKEYVFISYRGSSWKQMLDIVYRLQKKYGLRIYFDKKFAAETNVWIDQFRKNMDSTYCKAVLCIFDEGYVTSYATLLELMHAMNPKSQLSNSIYAINFPIDWETINKRDYTTGLGKESPDNPTWEKELKAFKYEFDLLQDRKDYKGIKAYFDSEDTSQELRVCDCKSIMVILQPKNKRDYADTDEFYKQFIVDPLKRACPGVFAEEQVDNNTVESDSEFRGESKEDKEPPKAEGYTYTIFGKEYKAQKQGQLMYDAVVALTERHPDKAEELTARTSISRAEAVTDANTQSAQPVYFRTCQKYKVGEVEYYVGMSYGFGAKIAEIKGMFQICGEDVSQFVLNGAPLESKKKTMQAGSGDGKNEKDCFVFTLWGEAHSAQKLADMMHDVFDIIAEKYPEKIDDIAHNDSITAVALKSDVDGKQLPAAKMNYFSAKKEHKVNGTIYYVSTRYNREQGIAQLKKMIALCEGTSEAFLINSAPDKSTHSSNEKKGLGELLID